MTWNKPGVPGVEVSILMATGAGELLPTDSSCGFTLEALSTPTPPPTHTHTRPGPCCLAGCIKGAVGEGSWSRDPRPCASGSRKPRQHLHLLGTEKESPGSFLAGPRWQPLWNAIENSISQPNPRAFFQCKIIYQINPTH